MKIGDMVRVVRIPDSLPEDLPDDDMRTRALFADCLNRVFAVAGIEGPANLIHLEVGEVRGEPACMHSIWIEHDCVELVDGNGTRDG